EKKDLQLHRERRRTIGKANIGGKFELLNSIKVQPIFTSVNPDRDTPKVMKKYCRKFCDKLIGLTGTHKQVDKAYKAYNVVHTIIMFLVDPWGFYRDVECGENGQE
ncbi:hypothetical protein PV326_014152, partial [Microctonus aethiopoides]